MSKPNLLFPTPVWTLQLENYKTINEKMFVYIKDAQIKDQKGISKSNIKVGIQMILISKREFKKFISFMSPSIKQ